jgi:hypothetical protein
MRSLTQGWLLTFALFGAAVTVAPTAYADTYWDFTLNVDGCSGGCGSNGKNSTDNQFATIQLDDNGAGMVTVTETLTGTEFVNSAGKEAIAFVLPALTGLSINVETAGFALASGSSFSMSPFGSFDEAIHCTACGSGGSNPQSGPLVFTVTAAGGVTAADFETDKSGYYFASDVIGDVTGKTGDVGGDKAPVDPPGVPEPATTSLLIGGIALIATRHLHRKPVAG